jgi:uncharacterized membrane protein YebE (DUF533 family)
MQNNDATQPKPSESAAPDEASGELDDEQLKAVNGGAIAASKTLLVGKKPPDSAQDQAATMTAIALAESGGRTG